MELYKYADAGVIVIMPEKEKKKLKVEAYVYNNIISHPSEVKERGLFKNSNNYTFYNWDSASPTEKLAWKDFFEVLVKNDAIFKSISAKTNNFIGQFTRQGLVVILPEKERKKFKAERAVLNRVISHPSEMKNFPDIDFRKADSYVFIGWSDANEEEREEWRKFHSM